MKIIYGVYRYIDNFKYFYYFFESQEEAIKFRDYVQGTLSGTDTLPEIEQKILWDSFEQLTGAINERSMDE